MPSHLPPDELLADYARGTISPGLSLLLAAHLTEAPESRVRLRAFERLGGALLADAEAAPLATTALDRTLARLDAAPAPAEVRRQRVADGPLPRPVLDQLGVPFGDIPWKFRLPGVSIHDFAGFTEEKVTLLRARPGASVPQHTHKGIEYTLVMQGVLDDNGTAYRRGDVAINDEDDDHRPRILGEETCYCLIVQIGDLHFTGRFSRILNYLGE